MPPDPLHTSPPSGAPGMARTAAAACVLFTATLAAYWPALNGAELWDDSAHITAPALQSLSGLGRIWFHLGATQQYYPVLHSAFWLEHRLWGDALPGYHLANVALHALAACLFAFALARLRAPVAEDEALPAAPDWLAAAVFALHPVCVESVAWISEQKNTLSLVFYLLSALSYLRFDRGRRGGWYAASFGFFLLAVLSKSVTATLPAALLLVIAWRRGSLDFRRDVLPLVPWFAAGVASGLFTAWVERTYIGAHGVAFDLAPVERLFLAGRVVWFYLGKLLWPTDLSFIYVHWTVGTGAAWSTGLVASIAAAVALWAVRGWSGAPLVGFLFFVGSLLPALGFFNVYPFLFSYVADHWQYLPSLGIIALVAGFVGSREVRRGPGPRAALRAAAAVVLCTLFLLTRRQAALYRDVPTLYADTLRKNPGCWMAESNLGAYLTDQGSVPEAIRHLREAIRIKADYADAHNNLGNAFSKLPGHAREAIGEFEKALRLQPGMTEAEANLGLLLVRVPGRMAEGAEHLAAALRGNEDDPRYAELHLQLGAALAEEPSRTADAIREDGIALRMNPGSAEAHFNLGRALRDEGDGSDAIAQYREALRLGANYAEVRNSLASALLRAGRVDESLDEYGKAVALKPDSAVFRNNLGIALTGAGRIDEAIASLREAVRLAPGFADAHYNLGVALRRAGRDEEAAAQFEAAGPRP